MASLKAIKRKATAPGRYREALIALGFLRERIDVLKVANGDTVLFRLGQHSNITTAMVQVFMDIARERGVDDVNCFLCGPEDTLEAIPFDQFCQIALMRGFVPKEDCHASSIDSTAADDGDCGASPGGALSGESGSAQDVERSASRLCGDAGEGPPASRRAQGEGETEGVRSQTTQSLRGGGPDVRSLLPLGHGIERDEQFADESPAERESEGGQEGIAEGIRPEEAQGERFFADEEVTELVNSIKEEAA